MQTYKIDRTSIEMAELANRLRIMANAADGHHAQQAGGTYGAAHMATVLALACGIAEQSKVDFETAKEVAARVQYECVDNGEDVTYQIEKVFAPGSGHLDEDGPIYFMIEVVEPTDVNNLARFRDRFTDAEWAERQANLDAAIEEEYGGWGYNPTAGEGCGA